MITLYGFGPAMGLPEFSPFVAKAHILLQMAGLPYETETNFGGFLKAPKGKLPYIRDDGLVVSNSTFIRFHIEKRYRFDFDRDLSPAEKAAGWALERMCEEHLYWLIIDVRWLDDANFRAGPARISPRLPPRSGRWSKPMSVAPFAGRSICKASAGTMRPRASTWPGAICAQFPTRSPTSLTCLAKNRAARTHPLAPSSSGTLSKVGVSPLRDVANPCPISSPMASA